MITNRFYRSIVALVLVAVITIPLAAKLTHAYRIVPHVTCSHSAEAPTPHDCNTCAICQFAFFSFTGVSVPGVGHVFVRQIDTINSFYAEAFFSTSYSYKRLRAPPVAFAS